MLILFSDLSLWFLQKYVDIGYQVRKNLRDYQVNLSHFMCRGTYKKENNLSILTWSDGMRSLSLSLILCRTTLEYYHLFIYSSLQNIFFWFSCFMKILHTLSWYFYSFAALFFIHVEGFRKGRGTSDQIANICWIIDKAREFQKNIYFCFIDHVKAFDCVNHNKLWKILKEMGIPDHLTCLLKNLYAGQEATVRTGHGTTDWFQIGKGECQGCILSPCLFNFYAKYIMRNAGLEEAQAEIKIAGRNINDLRYADDTILMAENEEELNSL